MRTLDCLTRMKSGLLVGLDLVVVGEGAVQLEAGSMQLSRVHHVSPI